MKVYSLALAAVLASVTRAQTTTSSASLSTQTYLDCTTLAAGGGTVTDTITSLYCNECTSTPHTTVYTTVYSQFCPTGLQQVTYTITESCTSATPTFTGPKAGVPAPGFTTTVETCTVCGSKPVTAQVTYPTSGSPYASSMPQAQAAGATPVPISGSSSPGAAPAPGRQGSAAPSSAAAAPAGGSSPASGSSPAGGSSPVGGSSPAGASSPAGGSSPVGGSSPAGSIAPAAAGGASSPSSAAAAPAGSAVPAAAGGASSPGSAMPASPAVLSAAAPAGSAMPASPIESSAAVVPSSMMPAAGGSAPSGCTGASCGSVSSGSGSSSPAAGNMTVPTPYTGSAANVKAGLVSAAAILAAAYFVVTFA